MAANPFLSQTKGIWWTKATLGGCSLLTKSRIISVDAEEKHRNLLQNIVAACRRMHVSPAKHSYAWLPKKCDRTDRRTNRRRTKWSLCAAMLPGQHNNDRITTMSADWNVCWHNHAIHSLFLLSKASDYRIIKFLSTQYNVVSQCFTKIYYISN